MDIESGLEVIDKNGKMVGTVDRIVRDSWTGQISKFFVRTSIEPGELSYTPEDVLQVTTGQIKLKVAFDKPADIEMQFGSRVVDKDGRILGKVDYLVNDTFTGKITRFRVDNATEQGIYFSMQDVLSITATEVKLKVSPEEVQA